MRSVNALVDLLCYVLINRRHAISLWKPNIIRLLISLISVEKLAFGPYIPIIKSRIERSLVDHYVVSCLIPSLSRSLFPLFLFSLFIFCFLFLLFCFFLLCIFPFFSTSSSITLNLRFGKPLRLIGILLEIWLFLTVLTPGISLGECSATLFVIGSSIFLLELLPLDWERSLVHRSSSIVTLNIRLDSNDESLLPLDVVHDIVNLISRRRERFLVNCLSSNIWLDSNERSQLPPDVVGDIVNRLHAFKDFIAAAGVSRPWRSACLSISGSGRPQLPWLMLSDTPSTDKRGFFSLCDSNRYQLRLSEVCGKRCWGSPHGWVVTLGPDYDTHLVHLMKRVRIALPPLNSIRRQAAREEWFRLVNKFILFKEFSNELLFLVIAIFGPMNLLAFARVGGGGGATLNRRRGQGEWAFVTNPNNMKFKDVACFNGQMFGLCEKGMLVRFQLDSPLSAEVQVISPHPEGVCEPQRLYLVESLDNLFGVFRYGFYISSERRHETVSFLVYKFDFSASAWEEVTDLKDHAVFVGDGNSWCFPTSTIPSKSNSIYFTDDHWDWQMYPGVAYGGHDVGVFDMASRVMQPLPFGKDKPRFYSRPTWVTPTVRLN